MDREALLQAIPSKEELHAAAPYGRKEAAENVIRSILDAIHADKREPDLWEAEQLASALGFIVARMYFASINASIKALAAADERAAPETWVRTVDTPTIRDFWDGLGYVQGIPAPSA